MAERPILFSGPMVRAILEGRKTVTRRALRDQPAHVSVTDIGGGCHEVIWRDRRGLLNVGGGASPSALLTHAAGRCPYGASGDRLIVREKWAIEPNDLRIVYAAGGEKRLRVEDNVPCSDADRWLEKRGYVYVDGHGHRQIDESRANRWNPSIHMPRWASRLTLDVVSVRVERLLDLTEGETQLEGIELTAADHRAGKTPRVEFAKLWDVINGEREGCSWADNPWVWRLEFRQVEAPRG